METTHGTARTGQQTSGLRGCAALVGTDGATRLSTGRRLGAGLVGLALGLTALAACTSGSPDAAAGNGTVTVTSTTTPPQTPAGPVTTSSSAPSAPSAAGGTTTTPAAGGGAASTTSASGGAEAPSAPAAGGLASCRPSQMRVTVMGAPGGGSAGHQELQVIATNTSSTQCTLQGYPGVSLTAPGTGAQLGAAADRVAGEAPLMRLEPGKTAVASILVAQAANYGASCGSAAAAGFRIYLPGQTAAAFAPFALTACRTASVHLLSVKPFTN